MTLKSALAFGLLCAAACSPAAAVAQPLIGGVWSGFSIGGHVGEAFAPNNLSFTDLSSAKDLSFRPDSHGDAVLGGIQGGYDWQSLGVLIGVQSDVSFAKDMNYLASVRGRVGFPFGPFLIYGTGGAAFEGARERFTVFSLSPGIFEFSRTTNDKGWVAGGGIDFMVLRGVSFGVQGLYYGMGRDSAVQNTPASFGAEPFNIADDRNFAVVRANIVYHFGW